MAGLGGGFGHARLASGTETNTATFLICFLFEEWGNALQSQRGGPWRQEKRREGASYTLKPARP